jgi:predicted Zn-dependent protease
VSTDPSVIQAVEVAVEAAPENRALRLHLAELLVNGGRPADALAHCVKLLADVPDDAAVLRVAATAAVTRAQALLVSPVCACFHSCSS